jgi:hypothetical protein
MSERAIKECELINKFILRLNNTFDVVNELLELGPKSLGQLSYTLVSQTRHGTDPAMRLTMALAGALLTIQASADLDETMD